MNQLAKRSRRLARLYRVENGKDFRLSDIDPGDTAGLKGDKERAKEALAESEACLEQNPDRMSDDEAAVLLGHIAWVHEEEKEFELAVKYYERVETYLRRSEALDPAKLVLITAVQGNLLHDLGRVETAREKALEAYRIATTKHVGAHPWAREVVDFLAETLDKNELRTEAAAVRGLRPAEAP